jgi:hypothetical protein
VDLQKQDIRHRETIGKLKKQKVFYSTVDVLFTFKLTAFHRIGVAHIGSFPAIYGMVWILRSPNQLGRWDGRGGIFSFSVVNTTCHGGFQWSAWGDSRLESVGSLSCPACWGGGGLIYLSRQGLLSCELLAIRTADICTQTTVITHSTPGRPRRCSIRPMPSL